MVALLKLAAILLCLASVSAVEKALLDKFAKAAVNGINNDKDSGKNLFAVLVYSNVKEAGQGVTFDLIAVQTSCPKGSQVSPNEVTLCHYANQKNNWSAHADLQRHVTALHNCSEWAIAIIYEDKHHPLSSPLGRSRMEIWSTPSSM
ncbi:hypothetical protein M514_28047 [Trichuris suis]|uniref:Cystatin domain-containing protein n=1 Tax=Trichuris suis TaxID=68888 RepID=A0A085MRC4_9BILA|nr:hypothetical protein M514_28047 [Trichuris suis]